MSWQNSGVYRKYKQEKNGLILPSLVCIYWISGETICKWLECRWKITYYAGDEDIASPVEDRLRSDVRHLVMIGITIYNSNKKTLATKLSRGVTKYLNVSSVENMVHIISISEYHQNFKPKLYPILSILDRQTVVWKWSTRLSWYIAQ